MKVVHIAYECSPIYKVGGLGDVIGSLPKEQAKLGIKATVIMPGYGWITKYDYLPGSKVPVFYVDSPWFIHPDLKYLPQKQAPTYAHFALLALEKLKSFSIPPDIIQCHDWHTGLIPFIVKKQQDPFFAKTQIILTLHNLAFQGNFPVKYLNTPQTKEIIQLLPKNKKLISYLKKGIANADYLTTVSPNYALEIKRGDASFGIHQNIKKRSHKFIGILNGIDYSVWNSTTDTYLYKNYDKDTVFNNKKINKIKLQEDLGLYPGANIPLFGFVARIDRQKGIEFLIPLLEQAINKRIELVILGTGDKKLEKLLKEYQSIIKPTWTKVIFDFDERLAHRIYAASNFFLIPSLYEPCGLTQMIAMRYGTIPIVSDVGGLKDTVENNETGFVFDKLTQDNFLETVDHAINIYEDIKKYQQLVKRVMEEDFSWKKSARKYIQLYHKLLRS